MMVGWFPNLTRAYALWQQKPSPSTEICFWHITAYELDLFYLIGLYMHVTSKVNSKNRNHVINSCRFSTETAHLIRRQLSAREER